MNRAIPTQLEYALLAVATRRPKSGYDLKKIFETTAMQQFSSSPGSIYPALRRLEQRGLLTSKDAGTGDRARRVYRPTARGRRALNAWLLAPVTLDEMQRDGRTPILRFAFRGIVGAGGSADAVFLASYRRAADAWLEELHRLADQCRDLPDPHPRLALLHGIEEVKGQRRWIGLAERDLGIDTHDIEAEAS